MLEWPTEEVLENICDAICNYPDPGCCEAVKIANKHSHDIINCTVDGTVEIDGVLYGFIIQNGNTNGTVVEEWGLADDVGVYDYVPPEPITFVPRDQDIFVRRPAMGKVYLEWRKQSWFKDLVMKYAYDRHFQPGEATERHYLEKAKKRGLVPGYVSDLPRNIRDRIKTAEGI